MTTYRQATDEMLGLFRTAWLANAGAVNGGTVPPVLYPHTDDGTIPTTAGAWCRVAINHETGLQRTLGRPAGRQFEHSGTLFVQVFAPQIGGTGYDLAQALADVARAAFEGKSTAGVWFRNVRINEIGPDGPFYQINIAADFQWSQAL
jgi:hypothetical protein